MKKVRILIMMAAAVMAMLFSACGQEETDLGMTNYGPSDIELPDTQFSAWIVYWSLKNTMSEIEWMQPKLNGISWFAAYFTPDEKLFIPDELMEFRDEAYAKFPNLAGRNYLTVVNDLLLDNEISSLKDTDLLRRKFLDPGLMDEHAEELISIAKENGFDGLEIDYEAIRSDMELWQLFAEFCEKVYEKAQAQGLGLRVLLEPGAPTDRISFPEGPEYAMMCYNLYGSGEEKGPKADTAFIEQMIEKMKALPGKKTFALATGGYAWKRGEIGRQITEQDAFFIRTDNNLYVRRDNASHALSYEYYDEENILHTVWYADMHTIAHWMDIIETAGSEAGEDYGIMLWRLGGNLFPVAS